MGFEFGFFKFALQDYQLVKVIVVPASRTNCTVDSDLF
jgi:hypothetical protein